jgi:thiosulfate sulfurtransferase
MSRFQRINVAELKPLLQTENLLLLDCRKLPDYQNEHIEQALHSHDGLVESLIKKSDKDRTLVIYCYHGHLSEHLAELFCGFGFKNVYSLVGGFESWKKASAEELL